MIEWRGKIQSVKYIVFKYFESQREKKFATDAFSTRKTAKIPFLLESLFCPTFSSLTRLLPSSLAPWDSPGHSCVYVYSLALLVLLIAGTCFLRPSRTTDEQPYRPQIFKKSITPEPDSLLSDTPKVAHTMSVVGIDFGNLNTVVAVARNRGIDVIVNEVSNRATPSLVSLGDKQRYLGESAKTQENMNFKNTVGSLKRLIGRPFSDPEVMAIEKRFVNANLVQGERGETAASVSCFYLPFNEKKNF